MRWALGALAAALALASCREAPAERQRETARSELYLLTALPLLWSEEFGLDQPASPAIKRLEQDYRVTPIDLPSQLPEGGLLFAAQPRALPAEELVALVGWVRRGGRLLLLADPMLEWPMRRPLGDPRRPPVAFPDTGLLQHWGLRLDAPEQRGPSGGRVAGMDVMTASQGRLAKSHGACGIEPGGLVAKCPIGLGRATIIADADFLDIGRAQGLDGPTERNLDALASELDSLSR